MNTVLTLFDHAAHNGSYLERTLLCQPDDFCPRDGKWWKPDIFLFLVGYRMWTKEESKLKIAAELIKLAMKAIDRKESAALL